MNEPDTSGALHPLTLFKDAINTVAGGKPKSGCKNGCVDCRSKSGSQADADPDAVKKEKDGGCCDGD